MLKTHTKKQSPHQRSFRFQKKLPLQNREWIPWEKRHKGTCRYCQQHDEYAKFHDGWHERQLHDDGHNHSCHDVDQLLLLRILTCQSPFLIDSKVQINDSIGYQPWKPWCKLRIRCFFLFLDYVRFGTNQYTFPEIRKCRIRPRKSTWKKTRSTTRRYGSQSNDGSKPNDGATNDGSSCKPKPTSKGHFQTSNLSVINREP